jgi:PAS domain S-box-containing protein
MSDSRSSKLSDVLKATSLLERLDEVVPGLVYVYDLMDRRNVYVNRSLAALLGHSPEQLAALGDQLLSTTIHPDDFPATNAHHDGMSDMADGDVREVEYRVRDGAGRWRWLHSWDSVLERDEQSRPRRLLGIAQDVTRRVQVEAELRESQRALAASEQRWRSIVENPFDFVVVLDRDLKFTFVNFVAPGVNMEDLIGKKSPLDFASGADYIAMKNAFEFAFREGQGASYETYVEPLQKWYQSVVGPIREGDVVKHLSVLTRDITSEKAAQAQARQAEQQLRQMELQLAQAAKLEAVGQLAGGIAHDFNNLLTGIGGVVELLQLSMPEDDPNLPDVLELRQAVERGAGLTRQLLAFSRQQPIAPTILDLNLLLDETSRMLRRLIGEDIELSLVPTAGELCVRADRTQLEQVLLNLAVNARDAMPGGGRLRLELSRARIEAHTPRRHPDACPGEFARLQVSDTGVGMDPATLSRIFEPFFTTKPIGAGTGLGLAMVHGIVSKAGGYVQVTSQPGAGATFEIWLPLAQERATPEETAAPPRRGGRETVLLVEDEEMVLRFTGQLLRKLGYEVLPAASAEDALATVGEGVRFDLLLTDVLLPGIDGLELFRRLAAQRGGFPVVFMSGYTGSVLAERGLRETGAAFLQKPFSHDELASKVRAALNAPVARTTSG